MGSAHDIMETFALRDIKAIFPDYDGWKSQPLASEKNHLAFQVSRNKNGFYGQQQNIYIAVSFDAKPSAECVSNLLTLGNGDRARKGTCLIVPQGSDISDVPSSVKILPMTAFGFSGKELRWLTKKKNALLFTGENSKVVS